MNKKLVCLLACGLTGMWSQVDCGTNKIGPRSIDFEDTEPFAGSGSSWVGKKIDIESDEDNEDQVAQQKLMDEAYKFVKIYAQDLAQHFLDLGITVISQGDLYNTIMHPDSKKTTSLGFVVPVIPHKSKQVFRGFDQQQQDYVLGAVQAIVNVMMEQRNIAATKIQKVARGHKARKENKKMRQQRKELEQSVPKLLELLKEVDSFNKVSLLKTEQWLSKHKQKMMLEFKKWPKINQQDLIEKCQYLNISLDGINIGMVVDFINATLSINNNKKSPEYVWIQKNLVYLMENHPELFMTQAELFDFVEKNLGQKDYADLSMFNPHKLLSMLKVEYIDHQLNKSQELKNKKINNWVQHNLQYFNKPTIISDMLTLEDFEVIAEKVLTSPGVSTNLRYQQYRILQTLDKKDVFNSLQNALKKHKTSVRGGSEGTGTIAKKTSRII
ncbi:hypothetical protein KBD08_02125 [Candidatus Babeliales bacterium]|nr:hypothetical protein [Candidatus Babeliales bacterium]